MKRRALKKGEIIYYIDNLSLPEIKQGTVKFDQQDDEILDQVLIEIKVGKREFVVEHRLYYGGDLFFDDLPAAKKTQWEIICTRIAEKEKELEELEAFSKKVVWKTFNEP